MINKKINTSFTSTLSGFLLLWSFLITPCSWSQNTDPADWETNPRAYVQNLASDASFDQIEVQNQIKALQAEIKDLKSQKSKTKNAHSKAEFKKTQDQKEETLLLLQIDLKAKIVNSKKYRDMLSLSDSELLEMIAREHPGVIPRMVSEDSLSTRFSEFERPDSISRASINNTVIVDNPEPTTNKIKRDGSSPDLTLADKTKQRFEDWIPLNPVVNRCSYQVNIADPNKAIEPEILFTYTPDEIKKHLRGTPYCKGTAFVGREPGYIFLQIDIEIASDLALQYYGNLSKSFFNITLVNGKEVRLINSRFDAGKIDPKKRTTTMSGMYYIDKNAEKILLSSELDSMRLNYASGYEDYTIYNVDFFTRQLSCLNNAK